MFASLSFQNIEKLSAHCFADLESTPFFIQFESTENDEEHTQYSRGEICLHLCDAVLAQALVKVINDTIAAHTAKVEQSEAA